MTEPSEKLTIITDAEIEEQVVEAGKRYRNFLAEADELGATLRVDDTLRISKLAEDAEKAKLAELTEQRAKAVAAAGSLSVREATEETPAQEARVHYAEGVKNALKRAAISVAFSSGRRSEVIPNNHATAMAERSTSIAHQGLLGGSLEAARQQFRDDIESSALSRLEREPRHAEVVIVAYSEPDDPRVTFASFTGVNGEYSDQRPVTIDYAARGPQGLVQMSVIAAERDAQLIANAMDDQPQMAGHYLKGFTARRLEQGQEKAWEAARPQPDPEATMLFEIQGVGGVDESFVLQPYLPEQPQPEA